MTTAEAFLTLDRKNAKIRRSIWIKEAWLYRGGLGSVMVHYPPDEDYSQTKREFWRPQAVDLTADDWEIYE